MSYHDSPIARTHPTHLEKLVLMNGRNEQGWLPCQVARHKRRDSANVHAQFKDRCLQNALSTVVVRTIHAANIHESLENT